jgi:hypothetical protein
MHVNGRLTAPPLIEVALVTNSASRLLQQGSFDPPAASGKPLEINTFGSLLRLALNAIRASASAARSLRQFLPVSAPQLPSAPTEAAAAS